MVGGRWEHEGGWWWVGSGRWRGDEVKGEGVRACLCRCTCQACTSYTSTYSARACLCGPNEACKRKREASSEAVGGGMPNRSMRYNCMRSADSKGSWAVQAVAEAGDATAPFVPAQLMAAGVQCMYVQMRV